VEITRQRMKRSLETLLCRSCPTCRGSGRVRSPETLRLQIQRELRKVVSLLEGQPAVIRTHAEVAETLEADLERLRLHLGLRDDQALRVETVEGCHPEFYEILAG